MVFSSVVQWRKHARLLVLIAITVGLLAADADAARRGLFGRFRRRGCPSGNCQVKSAPVYMPSPKQKASPSDVPPPPPAEQRATPETTAPDAPPLSSPSDLPTTEWRPLFDGESLDGWESTDFGGEGEVYVEDGAIFLTMGHPLTGINYKGEVPRSNYEVELEAKRVQGNDFFCGFTFPVKDSHCSLIVGGWGGGIVGLSSIDGMDASENETTHYMRFEQDRWYKIRVRVTDNLIEAWIDEDDIVYQNIEGRRIDTRIEVDRSQPFGIATYDTTAALRNIRLRQLNGDELAASQAGR